MELILDYILNHPLIAAVIFIWTGVTSYGLGRAYVEWRIMRRTG